MRIYDAHHGRRLVAAIEIVSPANKDRPESRRAFVAKVAALLQHDVCVSVVDIVTIRQFNLYADLLDLIDRSDPMLGDPAARAVRSLGPRPQAQWRQSTPGYLVLPDDARPIAADAPDLAGRRPGRVPRPGSQLRSNVPGTADRVDEMSISTK